MPHLGYLSAFALTTLPAPSQTIRQPVEQTVKQFQAFRLWPAEWSFLEHHMSGQVTSLV